MSTTPTPVTVGSTPATVQDISTAIQAGIAAAKADATVTQTFLQKHERLIIVVLFIVGAVFLTNHLLNNLAARDQIKSEVTTQQLNDQKAANTQLAAQVKTATDQYQSTITALTQQNSQLAAAAQTRTVVVEQQQKTDATLPLPDLG